MAVATRRLPGIRVDVAAPPAAEALPRMDVAVLVGFASTGPLHVPVAIESVAKYAAVFGSDAPLAWDEQRGERVYAYLGPAVRAFFANGGRRCWVIRVARVDGGACLAASVAKSNAFAIPGVLALGREGSPEALVSHAALAQARCEGSWSDPLRVATALQKRSFAVEGMALLGSPTSNQFSFFTRQGLRTGDLIEIDDGLGTNAYATIDAVRVSTGPAGPYEAHATVHAAFEKVLEIASPPASPPAPTPLSGFAEVTGFGPAVPATLIAGATLGEVRFDSAMPASLAKGHWARWTDGSSTIWMRMDDVEGQPAFTGSPPAFDATRIDATARGPVWRELGASLPFAIGAIHRAHLLALDIRVDEAQGAAFRLVPVGLTPEHPLGFGTQWTDAEFYRPREDAGGGPARQPVPAEVPRFPLARAAGATPRAWIPLGVEPLFGPALSPLPEERAPIERDGLSLFDASLFLDPEIAGAASDAITALADTIRFLRENPRALRGLHAAWSIGAGGLFNEASLLAIPDAIHLGWKKRPAAEPPEPNPKQPPAPPPWTSHRGSCAKAGKEPLSEPDFGLFLDCSTRLLVAPPLRGPSAAVRPGAYRLEWDDTEPGARYVLREASQPDFSDAREVYSGSDTEYIALNPREGVYYYQVAAWIGDDTSGGSNVITVIVRSDEWVQLVPSPILDPMLESQWLAVHRAALRMAAAGGELFVALTMPRHFRTQQALRYAARLRAVREPPGVSELDAFGFTERRVLTYGALYFPWLQADARTSREAANSLAAFLPAQPRVVPPDGVALGVLAGRASTRGAWIAAANEPMKDVVALAPGVAPADWQALQDAQVNLVRADPRGFLALSADTLALDTDLRPINVRRLLILLRRLALRRGISYVFEPNGPELRRAVQRGFDTLMGELFRRGAFAGATPAQSFRVVTDDTINKPGDYDAGRFLVELRVAPAIPMRFISILLAQGGERLTVTEEL